MLDGLVRARRIGRVGRWTHQPPDQAAPRAMTTADAGENHRLAIFLHLTRIHRQGCIEPPGAAVGRRSPAVVGLSRLRNRQWAGVSASSASGSMGDEPCVGCTFTTPMNRFDEFRGNEGIDRCDNGRSGTAEAPIRPARCAPCLGVETVARINDALGSGNASHLARLQAPELVPLRQD